MFYLKLILYYLRHPKQLAAGLWGKFKRIVKRMTGAAGTEARVSALEGALETLRKENEELKKQVGRLETDKTIRRSSAMDELLRGIAEETAEKRAADPKRLEVYGKVIGQVREKSGGQQVCAVDLGCGQGFWMEALEQQGISVVGVDSGRQAVSACREKQLNAVCADEAEWMRNCQSGAADLITVMQKAAAIGTEKMVTILTEAARVLRDGGAVIVEGGESKIGTPVTAEAMGEVMKRVGLRAEAVKIGKDFAVIGYKE